MAVADALLQAIIITENEIVRQKRKRQQVPGIQLVFFPVNQ